VTTAAELKALRVVALGRARDAAARAPDPEAAWQGAVHEAVCAVADGDPALPGALYEWLSAWRPAPEGPFRVVNLGARKAAGTYYTPEPLVRFLVREALGSLTQSTIGGPVTGLRVMDPAMGDGRFLAEACRFLAGQLAPAGTHGHADAMRAVALSCLHGRDTDPTAVAIARASIAALGGVRPADLEGNLREGDALGQQPDGAFDAILGNPPFVNVIEGGMAPAVRKHAARRGSLLGGTADAAFHFVEAGERMISARGVMALVVPRTFLGAPSADRLRAYLNRALPPETIFACDRKDLFGGANVFVAFVVLRRGAAGARWACGPTPHNAAWKPFSPGTNWWASMHSGDPHRGTGACLGDVFAISAGMTAAEAYLVRDHIVDSEHSPGPRLVTTGLIDPGMCHWGSATCRHLGRDYRHPRLAMPDPPPALARRLSQRGRPQVLIAGLSNRVEAFLDARGECQGAVSTHSIRHHRDDAAALAALCAHLNSPPVTQAFRAQLGCNALGGGSITMTKRFLAGLPMPESLREVTHARSA